MHVIAPDVEDRAEVVDGHGPALGLEARMPPDGMRLEARGVCLERAAALGDQACDLGLLLRAPHPIL